MIRLSEFRIIFAMAIAWCCTASVNAQDAHDLREAISRMSALAFTEAFPEVDRIELYVFGRKAKEEKDSSNTISPPEKFGIGLTVGGGFGEPLDEASKVPLEFEVHSHITIYGKKCAEITDTWRSLTFQPNGALCHAPPYGLRFYRNDKLLFETTVCWKCHNFYMPEMDPRTGEAKLLLYGFKEDSASRKLLRTLQKLLPIPKPNKETAGTTRE